MFEALIQECRAALESDDEAYTAGKNREFFAGTTMPHQSANQARFRMPGESDLRNDLLSVHRPKKKRSTPSSA